MDGLSLRPIFDGQFAVSNMEVGTELGFGAWDLGFSAMPFRFWSVVLFILGSMVGSLLNVCIYRMPRGLSIVKPRSHCPHCAYAIPGYLNIPIFTWLVLRGRCANCGAGISARYVVVELLTGLAFLGCWLAYGGQSAALALVYSLVLSGFIAASFIDFEHFIIPDEITLGGIAAGFLLSAAVPALHGALSPAEALRQSFVGIAAGGGLIYAIVRLGKLLFGRQKFVLEPNSRIFFTESALLLPGKEILYEEIFYRKSDTIVLKAKTVELLDRCYGHAAIRLSPRVLQIGDDAYDPESIPHMEVVTDELTVPREAMGLGDVKFMAAIGAFLGWHAVLFSVMASAVLGSIVGVSLIVVGKRAWSSRLPYGPYIALAATIWIFGGRRWLDQWMGF